MGSDKCVVCSRKVSARQHALQCDICRSWQHRVCNTGISQKEYRQLMRSDESIDFTCTRCHDEETLCGPVHSTHIEDSDVHADAEYGQFDFSSISAVEHTNNLNRTYVVQRATEVGPNQSDPEDMDVTASLEHLEEQNDEHNLTATFDVPRREDASLGHPEEQNDENNLTATFDVPRREDASLEHPEERNDEHNLTATFDVPRREDDSHSEIIEQSIQEPDLPDTIIPDAPITYSLSSKGDFTYWRCAKRSKTINCPATVSQKGHLFKVNSREHIHPADKGALKKTICRREVKAAAKENLHTSARRIVEDVLLQNITPEDHELPKVCNLKRMANQVRSDMRPEEPKELNFVIDVGYLQCENFLIGDVHVDDQRHLMFATPAQLRLLRYALRWYCDGTFKITPQPFTQLWSIHAFIRKGDSNKQVPLLFVLMSRRKTKDYIAVLQKLKETLGVEPEVQGFVSDFEKGVWKAIREVFPTASIKGCVFHFTQAVWRKTQELGLKTTYTKRGAEYRYIRMLMALPFLPPNDIEAAFHRLSQRATSPELQSLVHYMENTWMNNPVWRPRNWSIYKQSIRTNNDVEGYHTRINAGIGRRHLSFYIVVPALRREADIVELTYQLVSEEQILRDQRQKQARMESRLHQCWQDYMEGERTVSQLLSECGRIYGPSND